MGLLKLPRYMELADGSLPVTKCKKGDIAPFVILTNTREQVEKGAELLGNISCMIKGDEAALTVTGTYEEMHITISNGGVGVGQTSNIVEELIRTTEGLYPSQRVEEYVKTYHDLGVLGVEQEVSGILTMCTTKGCYAGASLMVIGNLVTGKHLMNGDQTEHLEQAWFNQITVILKAMKYLQKENFQGVEE